MTAAEMWRVSTLPWETSRFIGRRRDLQRIVKLQAAHRLLTLVGPGGGGKTRLALRAARRREKVLRGDVWFLDMAGRLPFVAISDALSWVLQPGKDRPVLLVLDTCDADIRSSAQLVAAVLREYPQVQCLATSREPLGLPDEVVFRVPLLSVPDEQPSRIHQFEATEAWQLFKDRVGTYQSGREDVGAMEHSLAIARLCRQVNGLPLAVEVVALQAAQLGVAPLATRATSRLIIGLPGRRDAPARQRSIQANLDWSYQRLTSLEQHVLRQLAVFGGDWTVEMAVAVCSEGAGGAADLGEMVRSLQHKSLVHSSTRGGGPRYELLEVTRQYGRQLLEISGEAASTHRRHLEWCVARAEMVAPQELDRRHAQRLERDQAELRVALEWALESAETELGLRLASAAFPLWYFRRLYVEGGTWFDRLLAQPLATISPSVVASARAWHTQLMMQGGDYTSASLQLKGVVADQRARSDETGRALSRLLLGNVMLWSGQLERARRLFAKVQEAPWNVNMALSQDARAAWELSDLCDARELTVRLLERVRPRQPVMLAQAHQIEALLASDAGNLASAMEYFGEAERLLRRIDHVVGFVDLLVDRGNVFLRSAQTGAAHQAFVNAAALARTIGARVRLVRAIEGVACALADTQPVVCVQLAAAANASRSAMHALPWPRDAAQLGSALSTARSHFRKSSDMSTTDPPSGTFAQAWQMGAMMLESEAASAAIATLRATPLKTIADVPAALTGREWEVAQLFASGASSRQIAERLTISRDTVRTHLDRATAKLGLHSRVQLAMWVARS